MSTTDTILRRFRLADIHPGENAREEFDLPKLHELAESLKHTPGGTLQPLLGVLRPDGESVDLIAGERRLRAAEIAGLADLEVKLMPKPTRKEWLKYNFVENLQREDLKPLEKAKRVKMMLEMTDEETGTPAYSRASLAAEMGMAPIMVTHYMNLLKVSPKLQAAVNEGLDMKVAALIGSLPAELHERAERDMVFRAWGGPMTQDKAVAHVAEQFRRDLRKAQFDREDAELVPDAGACGACPFFGGQRDDVEGKAKGYTCLNPACFDRKQQAHVDKVLARAGETGQRVLGQTETRRIFEEYNNAVKPGSGYVDIATSPDANLLRETRATPPVWDKILKESGVPVIVATDHAGKVRRLVESKLAVAAAMDTTHAKLFKENAATKMATSLDEQKHEKQITRAANQARETAKIEACGELLQALSTPWTRPVRLALIEQLMNGGHTVEDTEMLCRILKPDAKPGNDARAKLNELIESCLPREEQLDGFIILVKNIRSIRFNGFSHVENYMKEFCEFAGFNAKVWRGKIEARVKDAEAAAKKAIKAKEKPEKKAKGKGPRAESGESKPDHELPLSKVARQGITVGTPGPEWMDVFDADKGPKSKGSRGKSANAADYQAAAEERTVPSTKAGRKAAVEELKDALDKAPGIPGGKIGKPEGWNAADVEAGAKLIKAGTHKIADLIGPPPIRKEKLKLKNYNAVRLRLMRKAGKVK